MKVFQRVIIIIILVLFSYKNNNNNNRAIKISYKSTINVFFRSLCKYINN